MKLENVTSILRQAVTEVAPTTGSESGLSYTYVTVLVVVVAVIFLLLGIVLFKVYASCTATVEPHRRDSHKWLTEDNPHKWVDSNYDVTNEEEKKIDLQKQASLTNEDEPLKKPDPRRQRMLHRPSLSA